MNPSEAKDEFSAVGGVDMCEALERRYSKERQTTKDQIILNMVKDGLEPEKIAKYTGVTVEYVVKIKDGGLQIV